MNVRGGRNFMGTTGSGGFQKVYIISLHINTLNVEVPACAPHEVTELRKRQTFKDQLFSTAELQQET